MKPRSGDFFDGGALTGHGRTGVRDTGAPIGTIKRPIMYIMLSSESTEPYGCHEILSPLPNAGEETE